LRREGGQSVFAKHHGLDRVLINMILNGKRPVSGSVAKALGLKGLAIYRLDHAAASVLHH
jgi:hypothetical protein